MARLSYFKDVSDNILEQLRQDVEALVRALTVLKGVAPNAYFTVEPSLDGETAWEVGIQPRTPEHARTIRHALKATGATKTYKPAGDNLKQEQRFVVDGISYHLYAIHMRCEPIYEETVCPAEPKRVEVVPAAPKKTHRRLVGYECGGQRRDLDGKPLDDNMPEPVELEAADAAL